MQATKLGIDFLPPEYIFLSKFDRESTLVDAGCGSDADFSVAMIKKFGLKSIALDPTMKHKESLKKITQNSNGKFVHLAWAVSSVGSEIIFNESEEEVSGSIFSNHSNIINKPSRQYKVPSISLADLPIRLGLDKVEFIKLDLEGAEYELIKSLNTHDLDKFDQIFLEFHHNYLPQFKIADTCKAVERIQSFGFESFSIDDRNFLFFRPNK